MAAAEPIRISRPIESEQPKVAELYRMLIHAGKAALIGPDNSRIDLPPSIYDTLVKILETMQEGKSIAVVPLMEQLSTQATADFLGVSRQFIVRELEAGKIQFHYAGTHRRIYLKDVLDYRAKRMHARRASIDRMAQKSEESGDYDRFVPPDEE
ncbi:MAG TPA: excisionase family DNA-binding protein [Terriglobales bacterium]|nr:excisionase family DNA-binding protein [Terriglobales bacterium]